MNIKRTLTTRRSFERIDELAENRQIVLLFLQKLELMTPSEREMIRQTIDLLNHPIFVTS